MYQRGADIFHNSHITVSTHCDVLPQNILIFLFPLKKAPQVSSSFLCHKFRFFFFSTKEWTESVQDTHRFLFDLCRLWSAVRWNSQLRCSDTARRRKLDTNLTTETCYRHCASVFFAVRHNSTLHISSCVERRNSLHTSCPADYAMETESFLANICGLKKLSAYATPGRPVAFGNVQTKPHCKT